MKVQPISKTSFYAENFIQDMANAIEITKEEYQKIISCECCFSEDLKSVVINKEYTKLKENEQLADLRFKRESECFSIINRGICWYNQLNETQTKELNEWYKNWLNVTETKNIPNKPKWLK